MAKTSTDRKRTFKLGPERAAGELLWAAEFVDSDDWLIESQGGTHHFADGQLHVDCVDQRGWTMWPRREFPADLIIEYAGTCYPPSTGRNFNCFFCADYGDGRAMDAVERSGWYKEYHQFPNYIFTLTHNHTRMRRDPGFEEISELMLGSIDEHRYVVRIAKQGGRLLASVDDTLIHDVTDPTPHGAGWCGLRTWNTKITYDHWAVYAVK